ncbi:hypothetical protein ES288_A11G297100v1 [Gossypium darwinii]|uniref:Uncharacterized protein n=1 Tax=Gossypium darwinii TaxID=34276 RepID=A0A5D2ERX6_GOSDA|nr:hypothetical protein ES288_A11G297100v1 [Gossypium darwinii]
MLEQRPDPTGERAKRGNLICYFIFPFKKKPRSNVRVCWHRTKAVLALGVRSTEACWRLGGCCCGAGEGKEP